MTQIEQIKAEIERLIEQCRNIYIETKSYHNRCIERDKMVILNHLLNFINSLPAKQPSEDLEEAASRYAKEEYNHKSPATLPDRCRGCYAPLMYAFKAGANWQKEQMMKSAIDGTVGEGNPGYPQMGEHLPVIAYSDMMLLPKHFKFGDKIKIIVIKED